ncbi:MAG TPA: hypothetical protein VHI93_07780 [Candidatus Thermoplasmatota archaeon]|nr:hypothetical protein [Candidatus Thermoplasmatota archaeon]
MEPAMPSRRLLAVAGLLIVALLSGCTGKPAAPPAADPGVAAGLARTAAAFSEPTVLRATIPIHIVLVGVDPSLIDAGRITRGLATSYTPMDRIRSILWGQDFHLPLQLNLAYDVAFAPEPFAQALFANMTAFAQLGAPPQYLCDYDRSSGQFRLTSPGPVPQANCRQSGQVPKQIQYVSANATDAWIQGNAGRFGIDLGPTNGYTVFVLDSYTRGYMDRTTYHYLDFRENLEQTSSVRQLRTWGGAHRFVFEDLSAAPNNDPNDNSPTDQHEPPIWQYDANGDYRPSSTSEQIPFLGPTPAVPVPSGRVLNINDVLRHDVQVATHLILVPSNLYFPAYRPTYFLNVHIYQEPDAVVQGSQGEAAIQFNLGDALARLSTAIPWATFAGKVTVYNQPTDDPGMAVALAQAKAEGGGTYVSTQPVKNYVNANLAKYEAGPPGSFNTKVFYFNLGEHFAFALPVIVGGIASSNPDGTPWGVLGSHSDLLTATGMVGATGDPFDYVSLTAHEVGHFFGLNHPHDGVVKEDGRYREVADYTWDATSTPLSYRMTPYGNNQLDRDLLARSHTALNVNAALRQQRIAHEALEARGHSAVPPAVAQEISRSQDAIARAKSLFASGEWAGGAHDAVRSSIQALEAAERAVAAAGGYRLKPVVTEWDTTGINKATHSTSAVDGEVTANVFYDYRPIQFTDQDEAVVVNVTWTNGPDGHGDFFAGWHYRQPTSGVELALTGGLPGVWDLVKQKPGDGASREGFTLPLDTEGVRELKGTLYAGAGTKEQAANGAYHVKVTVLRRDYS